MAAAGASHAYVGPVRAVVNLPRGAIAVSRGHAIAVYASLASPSSSSPSLLALQPCAVWRAWPDQHATMVHGMLWVPLADAGANASSRGFLVVHGANRLRVFHLDLQQQQPQQQQPHAHAHAHAHGISVTAWAAPAASTPPAALRDHILCVQAMPTCTCTCGSNIDHADAAAIHTPHSPSSLDLAVGVARDRVLLWRMSTSAPGDLSLVHTAHAADRSLLYSMTLVGACRHRLVALAGTVFSDILQWNAGVVESTDSTGTSDRAPPQSLPPPSPHVSIERPVLDRLQGHDGSIFCIHATTDGSAPTTICSASDDRTVRVWRRLDGASHYSCVYTLFGHKSRVWRCLLVHPPAATSSNDVVMTPAPPSGDPPYLISSGEDAKIIVWNLRMGTFVASLDGHEGGVWALAFDRETCTLRSGASDATLRITPIAHLLRSSVTTTTTTTTSVNDESSAIVPASIARSVSLSEMRTQVALTSTTSSLPPPEQCRYIMGTPLGDHVLLATSSGALVSLSMSTASSAPSAPALRVLIANASQHSVASADAAAARSQSSPTTVTSMALTHASPSSATSSTTLLAVGDRRGSLSVFDVVDSAASASTVSILSCSPVAHTSAHTTAIMYIAWLDVASSSSSSLSSSSSSSSSPSIDLITSDAIGQVAWWRFDRTAASPLRKLFTFRLPVKAHLSAALSFCTNALHASASSPSPSVTIDNSVTLVCGDSKGSLYVYELAEVTLVDAAAASSSATTTSTTRLPFVFARSRAPQAHGESMVTSILASSHDHHRLLSMGRDGVLLELSLGGHDRYASDAAANTTTATSDAWPQRHLDAALVTLRGAVESGVGAPRISDEVTDDSRAWANRVCNALQRGSSSSSAAAAAAASDTVSQFSLAILRSHHFKTLTTIEGAIMPEQAAHSTSSSSTSLPLLVYGFHADDFVVCDTLTHLVVDRETCGGGRRPFVVARSRDDTSIAFVYGRHAERANAADDLVIRRLCGTAAASPPRSAVASTDEVGTAAHALTAARSFGVPFHARLCTAVVALPSPAAAAHVLFATSSEDATVRLFSARMGCTVAAAAAQTRIRSLATLTDHQDAVMCLAVSPEVTPSSSSSQTSALLFSAGATSSLHATRVVTRVVRAAADDHDDGSESLACDVHALARMGGKDAAPQQSGRWWLRAAEVQARRLDKMDTRILAVAALPTSALDVSELRDCHVVLTGDSTGLMRWLLFDAARRAFHCVAESSHHRTPVTALTSAVVQGLSSSSTSSLIFVSGATDGSIAVWQVPVQVLLERRGGPTEEDDDVRAAPSLVFARSPHQCGVNGLCVTYLGASRLRVVSAGDDQAVHVMDVALHVASDDKGDSARLLREGREPRAHCSAIRGLAATSSAAQDCEYISVSYDQRVKYWRVEEDDAASPLLTLRPARAARRLQVADLTGVTVADRCVAVMVGQGLEVELVGGVSRR